MEFAAAYTTVDAHAGGEPLRIVTGGIPRIPGATILEKRRWVREELDHVRRALILEPRGHADMYGAYLTEPVTAAADLGVIFMHNEGYSDMCGHGIVALATVAVAQGLVTRTIPETRIGIDAPAGFIEAYAQWDGRRVGEVRFRNVPSFLHTADLTVATPSFGEVTVDVAFGGAFYAYLDAAQVGLDVAPEHLRDLIRAGDEIKHAVMAAAEVVHPLEPELRGIYGTILAGPPETPQGTQRNVCVFADREVDRSPTGTGTAGRVAQLVARGRLGLGEAIVNESIVGSTFRGRALERARVGPYDAVVPEVAGRAAIVGFGTWVVDPDDALGAGFFLR
ncbi:MAG: proline racemase family protein [Trueperaceae bacterium]|nr:proline racemase family protein [Trueperaceae bacterium]